MEEIFEDGWRHIGHSFAAIEYLPSPNSKLQALVGSVLTKLEEDEREAAIVIDEAKQAEERVTANRDSLARARETGLVSR